MNKFVSMDIIEQAFDEVLQTIDHMEETVESHTDIEINQVKLAQQEKIVYIHSQLSRIENKVRESKRFTPTFRVALGR